MDEEVKQAIARVEHRANEAVDRVARLEGKFDDLRTVAMKWQNRISRLFHYFKIGLDEEDPRAPQRGRRKP